jgi:hypothetical protein
MFFVGTVKKVYFPSPTLTAAVQTSGVVLVYMQNPVVGGFGPVILPYISNQAGFPTLQHGFQPQSSQTRIILYNTDLAGTAGFQISNQVQYRYILIPGGIAGRGANYTGDQLKAMTYAEVCSIYNIPQ